MARPDLGTKRTCPTTGRKFYDMNKDPIVSPYTGEVLQMAPTDTAGPVTGAKTKPEDDDEDEAPEASGPEIVSLEDVENEEEKAGGSDEDETAGDDDTSDDDDTFLEEEEEGGDVSDLIEGDMEDDEES